MGAHLEQSSPASLSSKLEDLPHTYTNKHIHIYTHTHTHTLRHTGTALQAQLHHSQFSLILAHISFCCYVRLRSESKSIRNVPLSIHPPACPKQIKLLESQKGFRDTRQHLNTSPSVLSREKQSPKRDSNQ